MKIAVIGTGYVGLVSGACFADKGFEVTCVDIDQHKIDSLNSGKVPIFEPGLKDIIDNAVKRECLSFTTDLKTAVLKSKVIFICVGTPEGKDGRPDMSAVYSVAGSVGKILAENPSHELKILATKSTVPVGTGDEIELILDKHCVKGVAVVSNPEFLKEGDAINDFIKPDRVVIGAGSQEAMQVMTEMYSAFTRKNDRILQMDRRSAELTKYAANSMLALRITFMNQLANLCERVDADITNVRHGIGSDSRIGSAFLFPGPGYGGSCFPKDVKALIHLGQDNGFPLSIVEAVDDFNQRQKLVLAQKVMKHFSGDLKGRVIAVWGLSFKPQTDDVRESPSIYIIGELLKAGAQVKAYDPEATENFRRLYDFNSITYCNSKYDAVKNADALVIVTDWNEFKMPDFEKMRGLMNSSVIFDGRNLYSPSKMKDVRYSYFCMGRKEP
ncbi:TPA: UDP-glucose/GDP-mannose dehydrogenase family protein [Candidatus Woesearchaeota archaeon]|nr:UDP-glucose/GDP-mannose dehydrogenase family protein [Candidatus Woesearchaeota archaeon]